jgi:hypothetical protein
MLKNGALGILALVIILWAANISYGFVHEASHALVVKTLGGQVYELYVNLLGTDAYTTHSYIGGPAGTLALELAGLTVTTLLAFFTLLSDYAPLPIFVALRTAIYAFNYSPGTDIYVVQQVLGNGSLLISTAIVALNLACASIAIIAMTKNMSLREPVLKRFLHL